MTDTTPATPDPADSTATDITVGGSIQATADGEVTPTDTDPNTGQPHVFVPGVPLDQPGTDEDVVSESPDDVAGDRVYMSLVWMNVTKDEALRIRDAALAAAGELTSYSVEFSSPVGEGY
jgi:hypothetical protein